MKINWFPGHMKKAANQIKENLSLVDLCCQILDARIPYSSRNLMLEEITDSKPLLYILNKADMANRQETDRWISYLSAKGKKALAFNSLQDRKAEDLYQASRALLSDEFRRREEKGIDKKEIRMMVFGIPNSGKSSFINNLSKRRSAKVGNRPGVTTNQQWINTDVDLKLMDTPGILWHKLDENQSIYLAYTGAIKDDILHLEDIALSLIKDLLVIDESILIDRYSIEPGLEAIEAMDAIGQSRGAISKGGYVDYLRTAQIVLDDFRKLRLGKITLERVGHINEKG